MLQYSNSNTPLYLLRQSENQDSSSHSNTTNNFPFMKNLHNTQADMKSPQFMLPRGEQLETNKVSSPKTGARLMKCKDKMSSLDKVSIGNQNISVNLAFSQANTLNLKPQNERSVSQGKQDLAEENRKVSQYLPSLDNQQELDNGRGSFGNIDLSGLPLTSLSTHFDEGASGTH